MDEELSSEASSIQALLEGKSIARIIRPRGNEVCIECSDGTRLFVNSSKGQTLEFSITGGTSE